MKAPKKFNLITISYPRERIRMVAGNIKNLRSIIGSVRIAFCACFYEKLIENYLSLGFPEVRYKSGNFIYVVFIFRIFACGYSFT